MAPPLRRPPAPLSLLSTFLLLGRGLCSAEKLNTTVHPDDGPPAPPQRPNIIFLFADDMGIGDLECYGHPYAVTPTICDLVGGNGTIFKNFHVTGATCSPSRTGCMTSRSPAWYSNYMADFGFQGAPTITEILKESGYRTAHIGKWHIGPDEEIVNGNYGIDYIDIIGGVRGAADGRDFKVYKAAIEYIEGHVNEHGTGPNAMPLYMNVWGHISHSPVVPPKDLVEEFKYVELNKDHFGEHMQAKIDSFGKEAELRMQEYVTELNILDNHVKSLIESLKKAGIYDNTLLVFSSDQGPTGAYMGSTGPYQGGKFTIQEGGVRVPFIASWPGMIPAGRVNTETVMSCLDWAPTLCSVAQVENCPRHLFEGEDMYNIWLGLDPDDRPRERPLFWRFSTEKSRMAVMYGRYKLYKAKNKELDLYDVEANPEENINLAYDDNGDETRVTELMLDMLETWDASLPDTYCSEDDNCDKEKILNFSPFEPPVPIDVPAELIPTPSPTVSRSPSVSPTASPVESTELPTASPITDIPTSAPVSASSDSSEETFVPTASPVETGNSNLYLPDRGTETFGQRDGDTAATTTTTTTTPAAESTPLAVDTSSTNSVVTAKAARSAATTRGGGCGAATTVVAVLLGAASLFSGGGAR
uniref:Sulfatase N-terminal domain-containing protein n=1 Tax=Odontella aurita TaxID=265563 RepID=A0A7S4MLD3_9STRA|mmetsp:Transcript_25275/g.74341  ORF Transcript_25275/g.74341 Transcript_25275/m.74341 type:complete len:643 (+) Transcript_25275:176-2104(+)